MEFSTSAASMGDALYLISDYYIIYNMDYSMSFKDPNTRRSLLDENFSPHQIGKAINNIMLIEVFF